MVSDDKKQIAGPNWDLANEDAARWARGHVGELVQGITNTTRDMVQREVSEFTRNKESITQLSQRLATSPAFSDERARMIAVTEVTRAYSEGNAVAWKESGVTEGREWLTSVDERVCPICGPLHGQVKPWGEQFESRGGSFDGPPAHPRCRCDTAPVVIGDVMEAIGDVEYVEGEGFVRREERPLEEQLPLIPVEPVDVERGRFRDFDASTQTGEAAVESWEMDSSYVAWEKGLTEDERFWLENYKQDGYEGINRGLRGGEIDAEYFADFDGTFNDAKKNIDTALRQHRLPNDITVWRGGSQPQLNAILDQGRDIGDLKGMVISDDAYISTSVNKASADDFVKWAGDDAFEFEIQAPRGTFGAYIEGMDRGTQEFEYLLARGTKMEILDASIEGGVRKVVARILG